MSYKSPAASTTDYGVVEVGANIKVASGVISLGQGVDVTDDVTFNTVTSTGAVTDTGNRVVTSVTPTAGTGISLSSVTTSGPAAAFTIDNTGVTSIIAGTGISVDVSTGDVTVSATGVPIVNTVLITAVDTPYTALATDDYIGVSSAIAMTINLPAGINGRSYIIKDEGGLGGVITIVPNGAETIEGAASYISNVPLSSVTFLFRGTNWNAI